MNKKQNVIRSIIVSIILIMLLSAGSVSCRQQPVTRRYSTDILGAFDTVITIIAYCESDESFEQLQTYASDRFTELHQLYDRYSGYEGVNNTYTINQQAGLSPVSVEQELLDLIQISITWHEQSPGVTNIALGPVLELWHDYRAAGLADPENASLPPDEALEEAYLHSNIDQIEIDSAAMTVFLPDPAMRLDLGAIAKGYATEQVANELISMGYESFLISSGGNVKAVGQPQDESRTQWGIGIQNPKPASDDDQLIDTAFVNNASLVTSGDYQRYYVVGGLIYHHIIDPRTLYPGDYYLAVTVLVEDSGFADFLSTTLFLLPYEESRAYIDTLPAAEALWVLPDGEVKVTDGFNILLKERGGAVNPPPE